LVIGSDPCLYKVSVQDGIARETPPLVSRPIPRCRCPHGRHRGLDRRERLSGHHIHDEAGEQPDDLEVRPDSRGVGECGGAVQEVGRGGTQRGGAFLQAGNGSSLLPQQEPHQLHSVRHQGMVNIYVYTYMYIYIYIYMNICIAVLVSHERKVMRAN
jgi:hypothetical protein